MTVGVNETNGKKLCRSSLQELVLRFDQSVSFRGSRLKKEEIFFEENFKWPLTPHHSSVPARLRRTHKVPLPVI